MINKISEKNMKENEKKEIVLKNFEVPKKIPERMIFGAVSIFSFYNGLLLVDKNFFLALFFVFLGIASILATFNLIQEIFITSRYREYLSEFTLEELRSIVETNRNNHETKRLLAEHINSNTPQCCRKCDCE